MGAYLYSWNVNGMRAAVRNGFPEWFDHMQPDVLCIQETRCRADDLPPAVRSPRGYGSVWHSAERSGYSGVAAFFKSSMAPLNVQPLGIEEFDIEGRVQVLEFPTYYLINAYFPNSRPERERLGYKLAFNDAVRTLSHRLCRTGKHVIVCGDFNVAHTRIDLARPDENQDNPGFYPEERAGMDRFLRSGFVDVFRRFHPGEPGHYTWWSYRNRARERNIGWRLDYHCVNEAFMPRVKHARILTEVDGADHCPIALALR